MPERKHITRGLRFTLTAVYTFVFTLLLVAVSLFFRQNLASNLDKGAREDLDQNWTIVKAYLRIEGDRAQNDYHPQWFADPKDPEETATVAAVKKIYLITDAQGQILEGSENYKSLGMNDPNLIRAVLQSPGPILNTKTDGDGTPYLIRSGYVNAENDRTRKFYVAIGTSLERSKKLLSQFTWQGFLLLPVVILTGRFDRVDFCGAGVDAGGRDRADGAADQRVESEPADSRSRGGRRAGPVDRNVQSDDRAHRDQL